VSPLTKLVCFVAMVVLSRGADAPLGAVPAPNGGAPVIAGRAGPPPSVCYFGAKPPGCRPERWVDAVQFGWFNLPFVIFVLGG
jgi:hypothetical protein